MRKRRGSLGKRPLGEGGLLREQHLSLAPDPCLLSFIQSGRDHLINPRPTDGETEVQHRRTELTPLTRSLGKQEKEQVPARDSPPTSARRKAL